MTSFAGFRSVVISTLVLFVYGCSIPYKIPLRKIETNTKIFEKEVDIRSFEQRSDDLIRTFDERRARKEKMSADEAFFLFGIQNQHFRKLPREEVKKNLLLPENIISGWTTEETVRFLAPFRGHLFVYTNARKGGYIGFPKLITEQEGIDSQVIIITYNDEVFNIISSGGLVFTERQSIYWWEFASQLLRGFLGEAGKEAFRQGKKLFW